MKEPIAQVADGSSYNEGAQHPFEHITYLEKQEREKYGAKGGRSDKHIELHDSTWSQ
jgi:hypothetical protein